MFVIDSGYCKLKVRDGAGGGILGLHPEALSQALSSLSGTQERLAEVLG